MVTRGRKIRVLFVDDDLYQHEASKLLFEVEDDMDVNWCPSPDDAIKGHSEVSSTVW